MNARAPHFRQLPEIVATQNRGRWGVTRYNDA
jgi:hypothetical protein